MTRHSALCHALGRMGDGARLASPALERLALLGDAEARDALAEMHAGTRPSAEVFVEWLTERELRAAPEAMVHDGLTPAQRTEGERNWSLVKKGERIRALRAMGKIGGWKLIDFVGSYVKNDDAQSRVTAAVALFRIGRSDRSALTPADWARATDVIHNGLVSDDERVRSFTFREIQGLDSRHEELIPVLVRASERLPENDRGAIRHAVRTILTTKYESR